MKELIVTAVLIGKLTITSYRAVPDQTDSTPYYTSTNEHVRAGGCAVSRDLLCPACKALHRRCSHPENPTKIHYGDWLYVRGYGYRQANDVMGLREHYWIRTSAGRRRMFKTIRRQIDLFVGTWKEEHSVNVRHADVFNVKEVVRETP